ncbi:MAG TPA: hypothetical protein VGH19_06840 [Verrucomicrobiae bacterium]
MNKPLTRKKRLKLRRLRMKQWFRPPVRDLFIGAIPCGMDELADGSRIRHSNHAYVAYEFTPSAIPTKNVPQLQPFIATP